MERTVKDLTVVILTESGAPYNDKGIDYVKNSILEEYNLNPPSPLVEDYGDVDFNFMVYNGHAFNDPKYFIKFVEKHPDTHVVVSKRTGMPFIFPKAVRESMKNNDLEYYMKQGVESTWEIFDIMTSDDSGLPPLHS